MMRDREPEDEAMPTAPQDLFTMATDESADPYQREAAIKRLGEAPSPAKQYLDDLAGGAALSAIEQSLATTVLDDYSVGDDR